MYIPGRSYLYQGNLLLKADITASSEAVGGEARSITDGYSRAAGDLPHAWLPLPEDAMPELRFRWDAPVLFNFIEITFQTRGLAPDEATVNAFLNGEKVFSCAKQGKKTRREAFFPDKPLSADAITLKLGSSAGVCLAEVSLLDDEEIAWRRRAAANMKRPDPIPVLPWERAKPV